MRFVRFKQFREDTSFAAAVPANAVGGGTAIATIDPLLNKQKKRSLERWAKAQPVAMVRRLNPRTRG